MVSYKLKIIFIVVILSLVPLFYFLPLSSLFRYLRLLDFMLYLRHRSLPSRLSPKKSLILPSAKIRKPPLVSVRVCSTQKAHENSKLSQHIF